MHWLFSQIINGLCASNESFDCKMLCLKLVQVLEGLEMTQDQFVDLCILLGCDYCDKIKGVGPKNALKLIQVTIVNQFQCLITFSPSLTSCRPKLYLVNLFMHSVIIFATNSELMKIQTCCCASDQQTYLVLPCMMANSFKYSQGA